MRAPANSPSSASLIAFHSPCIEATYTIAATDKCPLYVKGDLFHLNGIHLSMNARKPLCLALADDIRAHVTAGPGAGSFYCTGCGGIIKVTCDAPAADIEAPDPEKRARMEKLMRSLGHFSLFKALDDKELCSILPDLALMHAEPGQVIIRQEQIGTHLYILLEGAVEVLATSENILLATLGPGDVFGEMSLLSGNVCTATIRAKKKCRMLTLEGGLFRDMVQRYPSLQRYLFQLLAHRLRSTNLLKESKLAQGVHGNLLDLSLAELLQALNISHKSGRIEAVLSRGTGRIFMRKGEIVSAAYVGRDGPAAFFEMLTEHEGTFSYSPKLPAEHAGLPPMGEFMNLLMEGFVRIDERAGFAGNPKF